MILSFIAKCYVKNVAILCLFVRLQNPKKRKSILNDVSYFQTTVWDWEFHIKLSKWDMWTANCHWIYHIFTFKVWFENNLHGSIMKFLYCPLLGRYLCTNIAFVIKPRSHRLGGFLLCLRFIFFSVFLVLSVTRPKLSLGQLLSPDDVIISQLQAISQLFSSYPPSGEFC